MKRLPKTEQLYRLFLRLLSPLLVLFILYWAVRNRSWRSLSNRFACSLHAETGKNKPLWMHCASVGELNAALPLIKQWRQSHPQNRIVVTTTTATAARLLKRQALPGVRHYYLPLDYPSIHKRFIRVVQPRCVLVLETEIWLGMFSQCHRYGVPIIILNARLSQRTLKARRWLGSYFRASLAYVQLILARSQKDVDGYCRLGMEVEKIERLGNLKYASLAEPLLPRLIERNYYLAASTHPGEDYEVAQAFCANCPAELLVLAPRYPRDGHKLYKKLKKHGVKVQLRSQVKQPANETVIYIADTLGELRRFISHAQWVFTGGSLRPHGGHNLLEPAAFGVVQVTGPYTSNFAEETAALLKVDGLSQIQDLQSLVHFMQSYKRNEQTYQQGAERARRWVQQQSDVVRRYDRRLAEAGICLQE